MLRYIATLYLSTVGRPRIHGEATREQLLQAAEALVALGGSEALSVRTVAEAVGTSTRAVYSLFGGKEGLWRALYREAFLALIRQIESLPRTDAPREDLVRAGVEGFRRYALEHPNLFALVFEQRIGGGTPTEDDIAVAIQARRLLRSLVQRCVPPEDVETVTNTFHALCQGLASMELRGWFRDVSQPAETWERGLRALLHGFAS